MLAAAFASQGKYSSWGVLCPGPRKLCAGQGDPLALR
jgi:hypothetical protein